jgi:hypothetical protein
MACSCGPSGGAGLELAGPSDDDVALLRFAYKWLKFAFFLEKTLAEKKVGGGRREDGPDDDQAA